MEQVRGTYTLKYTHTATPAVILSDRVVDFVTSVRDQAGVLHPVRSEIKTKTKELSRLDCGSSPDWVATMRHSQSFANGSGRRAAVSFTLGSHCSSHRAHRLL